MPHRLKHVLQFCRLRVLVALCAIALGGWGVAVAAQTPASNDAAANAADGGAWTADGGAGAVDSGAGAVDNAASAVDGGVGAVLPLRVRVGTWNVRNYMAMDRHYDGRYRRDYPKPEVEKAALRQILLDVRPDILLLQEVGGAAYLRELQADLKREGLDYPYAALPQQALGQEASSGERQVAVLSRYPWAALHQAELTLTYFGERQPLLRALLEVEFHTAAGSRWSVFTLHLKSRYTNRKDDPESLTLRTAEATAIRNHIAKKYPPQSGAHYLIAGDFNDLQNSAPVRRFLTRGSVSLSHPVPCEDSRGEIWTYFYAAAGSYQRVDYLLASPALRHHVFDGSIADTLPLSRLASDHRLVYADVDLSF